MFVVLLVEGDDQDSVPEWARIERSPPRIIQHSAPAKNIKLPSTEVQLTECLIAQFYEQKCIFFLIITVNYSTHVFNLAMYNFISGDSLRALKTFIRHALCVIRTGDHVA